MANFTENNLLYHIFSKSPVSDSTTLGLSLNKSGHTLTTDDIFGEELPAFYDVDIEGRNTLTAYNNDICKIGNDYYYYTSDLNGSYSWQSRSPIADGECLFNSSSKYKNDGNDWKDEDHAKEAVVKYHKDKYGEFITKDNNGVDGNKFTVRVKKDDGTYIKQFISVTDKIVNSRTSNGYAPLVLNDGVVMEENAISESAKSDEMRYVANCYAGIIQFPVQKSGTDVASNIKISVWEYIGKTLTNVLKDIGTVESVIKYEVADSCPPASEEYKGYIYFIPSPTAKDKNVYDELICVHDGNEWKWEQIGSTAINQETHEEWHNKNDYKHIELYNTENVSTSQDQNESGVSNCYGFIFNTPYMLKLEKFLIHGFYSSGFGSGGNTNFDDLYIKIIDIKSGHVLAVSDNATVHGTSGRPGSAYFLFTGDNRPLLPKDTKYKIIFSSNADKYDIINDKTFHIAYANEDLPYPNTKDADKFPTHNKRGSFAKQYFITPNASEENWIGFAEDFQYTVPTSGNKFNCCGLSVVPFGKYNKTEEFNDVAYEALKIYQHTNEQNLEYNEQNLLHDISHKYDNKNNVESFNDGIITFSDRTEKYFNVQKAVIAKYLFRGDASSTITEFNTRKEYDTWLNDNKREHRNAFYYEYDYYVTEKDNQGNDLYVYNDDIDSSTGRPTISTLQNVINGKNLFLHSRLTKFNDDLSCLMNGFKMFANSKSLAKFRSALPSLTNGIKMFDECSALTKFETKLPNLVLAECMFRNNTNLTTINTCLPNLTHAQGMFMNCSNLSSIRFSKNSFGCLYNGLDMFNGCSKIDKFYYELPYLETADGMFKGCQLDVESVRIIAESLYDFGAKDSDDYAEDRRKHIITLGIRQGYIGEVTEYVELIDSKGWVVDLEEYLGNEPEPDNPEPDEPEQGNYDISEENGGKIHDGGYVKHVGAWRSEIYDKYDLEITRIPYNTSDDLGEMWGSVGNPEA